MNSMTTPTPAEAIGALAGSFVGLLLIVGLVVLAILGLLMPVYVMIISDRMKKMLRLMEKMEWYERQRHQRGD